MGNMLGAFIPQRWSLRIIANLDRINLAKMVMTNSDYEGEIQASGDTVWVRTYGNIVVQEYVRNQSIAPQNVVPTKEPLVVDKGQYFAFDVDSLDVAQTDINVIEGYTGRAAVAMSEAIDSFVFAKAIGGANAANAVGTAAAPINITPSTDTTSVYQQFVYAGLKLDALNVPMDGRWAIVTPYVKSLLLQDTTYFIKATVMGDQVIRSASLGARDASGRGFIGQIAGFDVYMSNAIPTNGTYWANIFGQGNPVSYAAQIPGDTVEALRLESTFATRIRGLLLHGAKVFAENSKRLGVIYTDNS